VSDVIVLCYHAISPHWPAALSVTPDQLRQHVEHLSGQGYRGVTFSDVVSGGYDGKSVAITFDDAYRSVIERALPILSQAGLPATVFAPTGFIGTAELLAWPGIDRWRNTEYADELAPMTWDDLAALAGVGWEIGSHTRSHLELPDLNPNDLDEELRGSRSDIEERLGRACASLAYPYGFRDDRVIEAAGRAGYRAAARTARGRSLPATSPLDWPRIMITRRDGERRFQIKVSSRFRRFRASAAWTLFDLARHRGALPHSSVES
jgi:peptidoglycan/xylan/chitin deacetylase (PgdA/CDA1 family)